MSNDDVEDAQWVSLLADGELPAQDMDRVLAHLAHSDEAQQTWGRYHLIGEVLRTGDVGARKHDPDFVQKLRRKLAQETIEFVAVDAIPISATGQKSIKMASANDGWWRRVAGVASVALVGVLTWQGYALLGSHSAGASAQLAQTDDSAAVVATTGPTVAADAGAAGTVKSAPSTSTASLDSAGEQQAVMLRDPRLDALLAAHRQFGGTSALQMPSGFLRNATFDEGQR